MKHTVYQVWVAGKDAMEKYGAPYEDKDKAIEVAMVLRKSENGSIMVDAITYETILHI